MRNPTWLRDELILALDADLRFVGNPPGKDSIEIVGLSETLTRLSQYLGPLGLDRFRNANGVYCLKLMNFITGLHRSYQRSVAIAKAKKARIPAETGAFGPRSVRSPATEGRNNNNRGFTGILKLDDEEGPPEEAWPRMEPDHRRRRILPGWMGCRSHGSKRKILPP